MKFEIETAEGIEVILTTPEGMLGLNPQIPPIPTGQNRDINPLDRDCRPL
jgi:hypothetical protein